MNNNFRVSEVSEFNLIGEDIKEIQMWSINHYIDSFCNNYNKLLIISRICELMHQGAYDNQFVVAKKSLDLFPKKSISEIFEWNQNKYIILSSKGENPEKFWHIIESYIRPMVFYMEEDELIPLIDFESSEAIKVTSMSYNSPVKLNVRGLTGAMLDLFNEPERREREEEVHVSEIIGTSAENLDRIVRASQTINDDKTPQGVKTYANALLEDLLRAQDKMNQKLGIRTTKIDYKG